MSSLQSAIEILQKAITLDSNGKYQEAISMYLLSMDHLRQALDNNSIDMNTKQQIKLKLDEYSKRVDYLKSSMSLNSNSSSNGASSSFNVSMFPSTPTNSNNNTLSSSNENYLDSAIKCANLAVTSESNNKIREAIEYYYQSALLIEQASSQLNSSDIENRLLFNEKKQEYTNRATMLSNQNGIKVSPPNTSPSSSNSNLPFPQVEEMEQQLYFGTTTTTTNSINTPMAQPHTSSEYIDTAIHYVKEAVKEDDLHQFSNAIQYYELSIQYFQTALQYETNDQVRRLISEKLTNSNMRCTFLKNKIQYQGGQHYSEFKPIPLSGQAGQKYRDPIKKKTVLEKLTKTIKGPKNISDHWL